MAPNVEISPRLGQATVHSMSVTESVGSSAKVEAASQTAAVQVRASPSQRVSRSRVNDLHVRVVSGEEIKAKLVPTVPVGLIFAID